MRIDQSSTGLLYLISIITGISFQNHEHKIHEVIKYFFQLGHHDNAPREVSKYPHLNWSRWGSLNQRVIRSLKVNLDCLPAPSICKAFPELPKIKASNTVKMETIIMVTTSDPQLIIVISQFLRQIEFHESWRVKSEEWRVKSEEWRVHHYSIKTKARNRVNLLPT